MSDWYKMNPVDWNDGTNDLSLEQEAAYLRICNAIYIANGPISNNHFVVAGLLRCNDRKAKRIIAELIAAGKLTIEDGLICNRRALEEVSNRDRLQADRQSAGSRGGIESAKSKANALKNKEVPQASASSKNQPIREEKREERREKKTQKENSPAASVIDSEFENWYRVYPRHVGKGQARRSYQAARKKAGCDVLLDAARNAASRYSGSDPRFIPHPATWLSGERWLDENPGKTPSARADWRDEPEYRGVL